MFKAQYDVLRANGHSPSEAFNEVRRTSRSQCRAY